MSETRRAVDEILQEERWATIELDYYNELARRRDKLALWNVSFGTALYHWENDPGNPERWQRLKQAARGVDHWIESLDYWLKAPLSEIDTVLYE